MFKFLKSKLKDAVDKFSKDIDEEGTTEETKVEEVEKEGFFKKIFKKKEEESTEETKDEVKETPKKEIKKEELDELFDVEEKEEKPKVDDDDEIDIEKLDREFSDKDRDLEIKEDELVPKKEPIEEIKESAPIIEEKTPEVKVEEKEEELSLEDLEKEVKKEKAETEIVIDQEKISKEIDKKIEDNKSEEELPTYANVEEKKVGLFGKLKQTITTKSLSSDKFNDLFFDLEIVMLENNVAQEVIEKIKNDLRRQLVNKPIPRKAILETIIGTLRESIVDLFNVETFDLLEKVKDKKPTIIQFIGVNGVGKTTSIAKITNLFQKNNLSCVIAASDTFRAASIEQLQVHADKLGVKLIKHTYGSDPAAVAFDAVNYAKSKGIDIVLIDTAGRLHNNINLMDEIKKITRVAQPDLSIFVGESITGNDCVEQAKQFNKIVGIDGIILSKADVDEKGGASISVSYITQKPILYLGVGQEYDDLKKFDSDIVIKNLGF